MEASATFPAETKKARPGGDEARDEDARPERVSSKTLAPERVSSKTLAPGASRRTQLAQARRPRPRTSRPRRRTGSPSPSGGGALRLPPGTRLRSRYDTSPPKRFLTLLALRLAVFADATTTNGERRVAMFDAMEACLERAGEPAVGVASGP